MTHPSFTYTPATDDFDAEYTLIRNDTVTIQVAGRICFILNQFFDVDGGYFTHRTFKTLAAAQTVADSF